jgi:hypothetical protein
MSVDPLNVGGVLKTVTLKDPPAVAPATSVTVHVTVVWPIGKIDPDAFEQDGVIAPSSVSLPETRYPTAAPPGPVAGLVRSGDVVNVGGLLVTVTVNDPPAVAPATSVTVQVTVVEPSGKIDPDAFEQDGAIGPSSTSLPATVYETAAPLALVAGVEMLGDVVNVGGLLVTLTTNEDVDVFPAASDAVQFTVVEPRANVDPAAGVQLAVPSPLTTSWYVGRV